MPAIKIRLLGMFRGFSDQSQIKLKIKKSTVRNLILILAESFSPEAKRIFIDTEFNEPRPNALILVNLKEISVLNGLETPLKDGDEVTLVPVSHGG